MKKGQIHKFAVSRGTLVTMVILSVVSLISFFCISYALNVESELAVDEIAMLQTIKEIALVILSLSSFNLVASILIEVQSKNALITDIIKNDVIASPEFYSNMDESKRREMCNGLERLMYFDSDVVHGMFDNIRGRLLNTVDDDYYYEECDYVVTSTVFENYIEKKITKKIILKSYNDECEINEFCIGNLVGKSINGMHSYELEAFEINGEEEDIEKCIVLKPYRMTNLDRQNEYNSGKSVIYNKTLVLNNVEGTEIEIKFISRTTSEDRASTFRVVKPCKKFSLIYMLNDTNKYRVSVDAFGFLDNAERSANNQAITNVSISFNDWIFKHDGVVVTILDKK